MLCCYVTCRKVRAAGAPWKGCRFHLMEEKKASWIFFFFALMPTSKSERKAGSTLDGKQTRKPRSVFESIFITVITRGGNVVLWADRLSNANSVTRLRRCSLPSRPSGRNARYLHLGAASLWLPLTNTCTPLPLLSNIHFSLCQTHELNLSSTHTQPHFRTSFLTFSLPHTHLLGVIKQRIRVIGC